MIQRFKLLRGCVEEADYKDPAHGLCTASDVFKLEREIVMLREQNKVLLKALEIACADIHGSGILIINFLPENVEELIKFVTEVAWKELNSNAI